MKVGWICGIAFVLACAFTGLVRRYAIRNSIMDVPNGRSSHHLPTPRGGGLAIVLVFILAQLLLATVGLEEFQTLWGLTGAGVIVAGIGFLDDHRGVRARWRLAAHFMSAIWALSWIGGVPPLSGGGGPRVVGLVWSVFSVLYLVWMLNLYNFMDGIDGLAAIETISVCIGAALVSAVANPGAHGATLPLVLAAATAGFLVWNYPPARIFMGDVGSGFLGVTLGILSIAGSRGSPNLLWSWIILLGAFVVDATFTLGRRVYRGERFYMPHRTHAYQYAARRLGHKTVTRAVAAINFAWLLPISFLVANGYVRGMAATACAYGPLLVLAWRFSAGAAESPSAGRVTSVNL